MNIYLVKRILYSVRPGEYFSFVAIAPTKDAAREMTPGSAEEWPVCKGMLMVILVGRALRGAEQGVIHTSFKG